MGGKTVLGTTLNLESRMDCRARACFNIRLRVEQAAGLFRRASSPPKVSAVSCRRKWIDSPFHPLFKQALRTTRRIWMLPLLFAGAMLLVHPSIGGAELSRASFSNTNSYFIDDTHTPTERGGNWVIDEKALAYSRRAKECRPAADDPEGNWGLENRGLICSARMVNRVIALGDPILVMITLRNVGEVPVKYSNPKQAHLEFASKLFLLGETEIEPWPFTDLVLAQSWHSSVIRTILPGFQHRTTVDITEIFAVDKPGVYNMTVSRRQEMVNKGEYIVVMSGAAEFTMIARPDGINRPRARPEGLRQIAEQLAQEKAAIGPEAFARNHYGRKIVGSLDKLTPAERSNLFKVVYDVERGFAGNAVTPSAIQRSNEVRKIMDPIEPEIRRFGSKWGWVVGIVLSFAVAWAIIRISRS